MDFEIVRSSVLKLVQESKRKGNFSLNRLAEHVYSMLQSELLVRCYDIANIVNRPSILDELDSCIPYANISEVQTGLPPFSMDQLKKRISGLNLPYGTGIFTIQLPDYQPRFGYRRSGIVLRQAVIKGEVENLFVSGVEHGSPASNAMDLQMGDRIYSISGYPLDWHTLEQLRYKLIELDGLAPNSNIYDLANYLLNRPYQNTGISHDHNYNKNSSVFEIPSEQTNLTNFKPPVLVIFRYPKSNSLWSNQISNDETKELQVIKNNSSFSCYETVLENEGNNNGLGLQIGSNQENTGIYIVSIFKNSQAERDGVLREGDRVTEVNYQNLEGLDTKQALKKVKSICRNTKYVQIKCSRNIQTNNNNSDLISSCSDKKTQFDDSNIPDPILNNEDINDIDNEKKSVLTRTPTPTMNNSETSIYDSQDDSVLFYNCKFNKPDDERMNKMDSNDKSLLEKWLDVFNPDVELLLVYYDIKNSNCGLGIGFGDTVGDEEIFGENQHHHYITEINPEGPIGKEEILLIGDDLLEINNVVIVNKDHLEISSIFPTIPSEGYLICARYPNESSLIDVKEENENDESALSNVVPFIRTPSDDEIPNVDFSGQISDDNLLSETNSGIKNNKNLAPLNNEEGIDQRSGSDIDESQYPVRLLTVTESVLQNQSSNSGFRTEDIQTDKMITEDIQPEIDKNNLIMSDQKSIESTVISSPQRLPMAVKLVKSMEKLPLHTTSPKVFSLISENNNSNHSDLIQLNEITNQNDDNDVLTVKVLKKAGEILGLELELESGDERGIKLAHITPGSPVDRLKYWNQYKSMDCIQTDSDYSKLSETYCINGDHLRIPTAGDRILSVSDYSFQNMSAFTALRLLRKLISYSGFINTSMEMPYRNEKLIFKNELLNVKQKIDQFNQFAYNQMVKSHSSIPIIKLNNNEFPWINERIYLRPMNKIFNHWNSNEQLNSKSISLPNITNLSSMNNQHNHEGAIDSNYDSLSVKGIFKHIDHKSNQLKSNLPTDKQSKYHETKREQSFTISNHQNGSDKNSSQIEHNQLLINKKVGNQKEDNNNNNNRTANEFINNKIVRNCNLLYEQFTINIYRNSNENLGFSVSHLTSLFNETSDYYIVISDIRLTNKNSHLQIGDCILSVNGINLINMDLMKSVKLLKSTPSPIQLKIQRLNKINLSTDINCEEDCLSVDTDTDEEGEIMTKIIDMAQNYASAKCTEIKEQLEMKDNQNINQCESELTITNNNNTTNDIIIKSEIQNQSVKLLRQKVIKWLNIHQLFIQSKNYRLKYIDKDHYKCSEIISKTINKIMEEDDHMISDEDDETVNIDEKMWKDERASMTSDLNLKQPLKKPKFLTITVDYKIQVTQMIDHLFLQRLLFTICSVMKDIT
ncbi:unnamed protein product [Schistosoma rodhaini]|nr:unnamed protein product [Schistosoma rodhaini]